VGNVAPKTYINDKGQTVEVGTNKVLRLNRDGSINMVQFNKGNFKLPTFADGANLDKANIERAKLSPYVGDDSEKNWETYFSELSKYPSRLSSAALKAGFERTGVIQHLNKHPKLKERYDDIIEADLDEFDENVRNIAFEKDKKYLPTILKANDTYLSAHAKDRGYGHKPGLNIESGRDTNIVIVNNSGSSLPGQPEKTENADYEEVKES